MRTFTLHLEGAARYERIDGVASFIAEDSSGQFGLLAHHERFVTALVPGLARLRCGSEPWQYLALPGGVAYFDAGELHVATRPLRAGRRLHARCMTSSTSSLPPRSSRCASCARAFASSRSRCSSACTRCSAREPCDERAGSAAARTRLEQTSSATAHASIAPARSAPACSRRCPTSARSAPLFVLPVVAGAYLGDWLDSHLRGYSVHWTITLIVVGVFVGAVNVYAHDPQAMISGTLIASCADHPRPRRRGRRALDAALAPVATRAAWQSALEGAYAVRASSRRGGRPRPCARGAAVRRHAVALRAHREPDGRRARASSHPPTSSRPPPRSP